MRMTLPAIKVPAHIVYVDKFRAWMVLLTLEESRMADRRLVSYAFSGELEALIGDEKKSLEIIQSYKDVTSINKEKKRPCPICGKAMKKVELTLAEKSIILDECPKKHGLWFDQDELYKIVSSTNAGGNDKVAEFLKDMFAEKE